MPGNKHRAMSAEDITIITFSAFLKIIKHYGHILSDDEKEQLNDVCVLFSNRDPDIAAMLHFLDNVEKRLAKIQDLKDKLTHSPEDRNTQKELNKQLGHYIHPDQIPKIVESLLDKYASLVVIYNNLSNHINNLEQLSKLHPGAHFQELNSANEKLRILFEQSNSIQADIKKMILIQKLYSAGKLKPSLLVEIAIASMIIAFKYASDNSVFVNDFNVFERYSLTMLKIIEKTHLAVLDFNVDFSLDSNNQSDRIGELLKYINLSDIHKIESELQSYREPAHSPARVVSGILKSYPSTHQQPKPGQSTQDDFSFTPAKTISAKNKFFDKNKDKKGKRIQESNPPNPNLKR